jgi:adenine deaminase
VQMPSCVPSAPGLETPGAAIGPDDVAEAMTWPGIIGLGEVMNFLGVYRSDEKLHAEMAATRAVGKVIGGHYASPDLGLPFHGYVAGGPQDDHEGTRLEDAATRVRQGMKAMLRFGSAWHDVAAQVRAVTEMGLDSRNFILCTDDSHSETLVQDGHVNRAVRVAIANGLPPIKAIQMATLNTAEHFGLAQEVGQIAPGRYADLLLVSDLIPFKPDLVISCGRIAAENGRLLINLRPFDYPDWVTNSVHQARPLTVADFRLSVPAWLAEARSVSAHVIGVVENQAPTSHLHMNMPVKRPGEGAEAEIQADRVRDIAKVAVIERHHATGRVQVGLVHGFGFNVPCAIGSTVAHDSHHMIVAGTDDENMAIAANELARIGGGQVVVRDKELIGKVDLPIGGLMSNEHADRVARKAASVLYGFRACGCLLNNPNMQLSLLALVVIPELRLSDLGLVDVSQNDFIPVVGEASKG